jgi:hypothetical protein
MKLKDPYYEYMHERLNEIYALLEISRNRLEGIEDAAQARAWDCAYREIEKALIVYNELKLEGKYKVQYNGA